MSADAVVIGAGPNGLVAANMLADRGWEVVVCEEQPTPGGAVRSGEVTAPGFVHDLYSAFYPLTPASRYVKPLELESYGLNWLSAAAVVAHPHPDGRCALLSLDLDETCASLDSFAAGDGDSWRRLFELWRRVGPHLVGALLTPLPPLRPAGGMLRALGPRGLAEFARFSLLPARRMAEESFRGEGAGWLIAGNALHADLTPDSAGGGLFGWLLCGLGQQHGYPVAEGGSGAITAALVRRLRERGGELLCGTPIERIEVSGGRATAALAADGQRFPARRAILADCGAPALYRDMLPAGTVPERARRSLRHFQYDNSTFKVNWALRGAIPWSSEQARTASTVHVAAGMEGLSRATVQLAGQAIPDRPFLVLGQYSTVDRSRAPAGAEAAWAYTHVPQRPRWDAAGELRGEWAGADSGRFADRMEAEVEHLAPGFRDLIVERHVQSPLDLEANNRNLVGGAINGGTAQLYQQAIFRPLPGLGRPTTPVRGLYLASASAHPGGGLHGGPGGNAATTVLRHHRLRRI
ncbi:MAG TPA: NAD(P)/FAD-dependent oxidoreductase [Solirubrobacterales bacterium]|jgi:phytoene dehydrogenase-like protein|nr:NAD(P)/FAD-dependent oxidoreductase [Solirubrobacterales bacterium]